MQTFQDTFKTTKRLFISVFLIFMTVHLILYLPQSKNPKRI